MHQETKVIEILILFIWKLDRWLNRPRKPQKKCQFFFLRTLNLILAFWFWVRGTRIESQSDQFFFLFFSIKLGCLEERMNSLNLKAYQNKYLTTQTQHQTSEKCILLTKYQKKFTYNGFNWMSSSRKLLIVGFCLARFRVVLLE